MTCKHVRTYISNEEMKTNAVIGILAGEHFDLDMKLARSFMFNVRRTEGCQISRGK